MSAVVTQPAALDASAAAEVRRLAATAAAADGVGALSEASRLALQPGAPAGSRHLVARGAGGLLGYAQVWPDDSAELVVAPSSRREGIGSALWEAAATVGAARVWAHGDLSAARGFAAALGLTAVRSLLQMGRPLTPADLSPRPLPPGYAASTFAERDAPRSTADDVATVDSAALSQLTELNAAAFAGHPEQGRLTVADLTARMSQPWFDPDGLILVFDQASHHDDPVAFHWTKIEPDQDPDTRVGEVYVVGVHPAYQGRGLAGPLTDLGLAHLSGQGCREVALYVDGENSAARATYEGAGLTVLNTDLVYAPSGPHR